MELKLDQKTAFDKIKIFLKQPPGGMFLLEGSAGTGKTFLTNNIVSYIKSTSNKKIAVTAPTHKALKVLKKFIEGKVHFSTTHSILGLKEVIDGYGNIKFKRQEYKDPPLIDYDILIVDEASMIRDDIFKDIAYFTNTGKKVIFIGDPYQTPPVGRKNSIVFEKEARSQYNIQSARLEYIIRQEQEHPILQVADSLKKGILKPSPLMEKRSNSNPLGEVRFASREDENELFSEILPFFGDDTFKNDPDYIKITAWRNKTVDYYNQMVRNYLFGENIPKIIPGEKLIIVNHPFVVEKQVLLSINEELDVLEVTTDTFDVDENNKIKFYRVKVKAYQETIYNEYSIDIIHEDSEQDYADICYMLKNYALHQKQGSTEARMAWMDYYSFKRKWVDVSYNYAITAHKAQGSTYNNAVVMWWDYITNKKIYERNRVLYTAITRPDTRLYIIN